MNIKRAKEEIRNTIEAYLLKNEYGEYEIPVMAQRPVFLIGAPGRILTEKRWQLQNIP